jgi:hypothetical protein
MFCRMPNVVQIATDVPTVAAAFIGAIVGAATGPYLTARFAKTHKFRDVLQDAITSMRAATNELKGVKGMEMIDGFGASEAGFKQLESCRVAAIDADNQREVIELHAGGDSDVAFKYRAALEFFWEAHTLFGLIARTKPEHGYHLSGNPQGTAYEAADKFDEAFDAFVHAAHAASK